MSLKRISIHITAERDNGVTTTKSIVIEQPSPYNSQRERLSTAKMTEQALAKVQKAVRDVAR